jgi:hypothetical protein
MLAFYVYVFLSGGNPPKKIASEGSYWECQIPQTGH